MFSLREGLVPPSCSPARHLFNFTGSSSVAETKFLVLIQDNCVIVWWPEEGTNSKEWDCTNYDIEEEPDILEGSAFETEEYIWIILAYNAVKQLTVTHLRFNKNYKTLKVHLNELFSMVYISCEMMHKCQSYIKIACFPNEKSVVSLPGPSSTIRLFLYDLPTSTKSLLTSIKKDSFSLFPVEDWDNVLVALRNNQIDLWNTDEKSIINAISLDASILRNKNCFNVLHDKGLVHLFLSDSKFSAIEVIALNPKTGKYASLMNFNLSESQLSSTNPSSPIHRVRRSGNHLLIIKDEEIEIYDMINNKSVLTCAQNCMADSTLGFIDDAAMLFGVTHRGTIFNLLNT